MRNVYKDGRKSDNLKDVGIYRVFHDFRADLQEVIS
jgi:hypothetical protein